MLNVTKREVKLTFLQAINEIEVHASSVDLKDYDGNRVDGCVVVGAVGLFIGDEFDSVIDQLKENKISIEEYRDRMMGFINKYKRSLNNKRTLKTFEAAARKQLERDEF